MNLLKYSVLIAACMGLTACEENEGTLTVTQPFTINMKTEKVDVPVGNHTTKVSIKDREVKIILKIKKKEHGINVKFQNKPTDLNAINVSAKASGQTFDVKGSDVSEVISTPSIRTIESCTWYTTENVCGYETTPRVCTDSCWQLTPGPSTGGGGGGPDRPAPYEPPSSGGGLTPGPSTGGGGDNSGGSGSSCNNVTTCTGGETVYVCRNVSTGHPGQKEVEFSTVTTNRTKKVDFIEPTSQVSLAAWVRATTNTQKQYSFQGECR